MCRRTVAPPVERSITTFRGLVRIRGIEAGAPAGHAEAFYAHKLVVSPNYHGSA